MIGPSRARATAAVLLVAVLAGTLAACGSGDRSSDGPTGSAQVVVSAAASLREALTGYGERFGGGDVRLSFAGSDELAAQIRQGVPVDVLAAANTSLPEELARDGKLEAPLPFAHQ